MLSARAIATSRAAGYRTFFRSSFATKVSTSNVRTARFVGGAARTFATRVSDVNPDEDVVVNKTAPESEDSVPSVISQPVMLADSNGFAQRPAEVAANDWTRSFHGLSSEPFSKEIADILQAPIDPLDVEMKPDGLLYLPEIKYRRILNKAFGPGGWGLAPRSETNVGAKIVSREYGLVCLGRLVAVARGEQEYFDPSGIPTATEGCKSNALMRCCKDLGIASELWDPRFIRQFKAEHCVEVFVEHIPTKRKRKLWRRKDAKLEYPYKE
ncbi:hypothetical protein FRB99_005984 [Tulasnella sp. 403]|nr:hypothetical protein FRB99_005984 [Tulasnella sp. 403]